MSCFQVSKATIAALLTFYRGRSQDSQHITIRGQMFGHRLDDATWLALGVCLWDANARSVTSRYHITREAEGIEEFTAEDIGSLFDKPRTPVQILKLIDCVEYQSCEDSAWEDSTACAVLHRIQREAIAALPGYEEAPWGLPELAAK